MDHLVRHWWEGPAKFDHLIVLVEDVLVRFTAQGKVLRVSPLCGKDDWALSDCLRGKAWGVALKAYGLRWMRPI
jgi:hypothetical protein